MRAWLSTLLVAHLLLLSAGPALGATITAASCSRPDVVTAIASASNGDTVVVPAGSCTWDTSTVTISGKAITLQGTGTLITNANGSARDMVQVAESTAGHVRITGFTFPLPTVDGTGNRATFRVQFTSSGQAAIFDHLTFTGVADGPAAFIVETNRGVFYSNTFTSGSLATNIIWEAFKRKAGALTSSWTTASTMGTADTTGEGNVFFETNTVINIRQFADLDDNSRTVIRYNTFTNSDIVSHGQDTSPEGVRHWEIYNNTWVWDDTPCNSLDPQQAIHVRGGTGVIFGNTIPNLRVCGGFWGDKPEITMQVQVLRRSSGISLYPCWGTTTPGSYPSPRQLGQSHNGSTIVTDPVYIWNNTSMPAFPQDDGFGHVSLQDFSPNECGGGAPLIADYVQSGRDYVACTNSSCAKAGYTAYTYPHPLSSGVTPPPAVTTVGRLGTRFPGP